ncbi:hypothetical protein D3C71_2035010 [compost metagenome]
MGLYERIDRPACLARPEPGHGLNHLADGCRPFAVGAEVPSLGDGLPLLDQCLGQQQVSL